MIGNNRHNSSAFTLIEVLVAVAIFASVILMSSRIYQNVLNNQHINRIDQDIQENIKYFLEVFSREASSALRNNSTSTECLVGASHIFATDASSTELYFRNSGGECVQYYSEADNGITRLAIDRDGLAGYITSPKVLIKGLNFVLDESSTTTQPIVTVNVQVQSEDDPNIAAYNIQTTISPRDYE
jgi:prepilin-type N-terminal cleavage/methylation domain-containing protein